MGVPTIALYATPTSTVCSTAYPYSHPAADYELAGRPCSSSPAPSQRPFVGGLSCLFASQSVKHSCSSPGDELGSSMWYERNEELSSFFSYSPYSSLKGREQSPVSVFQGPVSCSAGGSATSPPAMKYSREIQTAAASLRSGRDGLFNGFVRNALGSCLDYDLPPLRLSGGSLGRDDEESSPSMLVDELTFAMEDPSESDCKSSATELLAGAQSRHNIFYEELVVNAFHEAEKAHRGQMRASGDPYLQHCVETGVLLATIGANVTVVAAGLLHDTLDDSFMDYNYICRTFGAGVADLVEGVSKLSQLSKLARDSNIASKTAEADRLHTLFLAMGDARAVLIKLADRLHNMMTLDALPADKQHRFAKETLEIFAPLANRLGISSWKEQVENLCFKYLNPEQHEMLSSKLVKSFDEAAITSAIEKLEGALRKGNISYHALSGRHKSLYSTYCKMLKKKLTMDEIHDIHGLRLIVEKEKDCYKALSIVQKIWSEAPGKFKDYITKPKLNGYKSLHTIVMSDQMVPLEVQIRTKEMHLQAEFGFAAHWRYKEGDCEHSSYVLQMVEWARWVVTWQCETMNKDRVFSLGDYSVRPACPFPSHAPDCPFSYAPHCHHDGPIFVILIENEKMSVQEFPANSTVSDLLDRAGRGSSRCSPYRFPLKQELRPRLNHEPISDPSRKLMMGDVIELTPSIPDKCLTECREEIQRMYDRDLIVSAKAGWRS